MVPLLTYVLPLLADCPMAEGEIDGYLAWVGRSAELIVVDGSDDEVFEAHHRRWDQFGEHVRPETPGTGKGGGVMTGLRRAGHDRVVIADDDVRYDRRSLARLAELLELAEVVRPQNYFDPLPWHATWDSGRSLVNRLLDGDWPGTLGVHRSVVLEAGGYAGGVLFENFELCRTVETVGGCELVARDLYVRRLPPTARHFLGQRVRQAYDELARPRRLVVFLLPLPVGLGLAGFRRWRALGILSAVGVLATVAAAEGGRRCDGATGYFPFRCSLAAPLWLAERSVCVWLAVLARLRGGVVYRGGRVRRAALSSRNRRAAVEAVRAA